MRPAIATTLILALLGAAPSHADDWPMLGRDGTRNAVSPERNPPVFWQIEGVATKFDEKWRVLERAAESKNIKWIGELGRLTLGDPVVSGGLVWVGTNNRRGPDEANAFVLMCFRESDGELLYRHVTPRALKGWGHEWSTGSFSCSPLAEGDRIWFVTNRSEAVCLDVGPLRRGEGEPRLVWQRDMSAELGVVRRPASMALNRTCSVASYGDWIYVITGNGTDETRSHIPAPEAPSLVCFEKDTGRVVWQDNSPGANILYGQWASPLVIEIDDQPQCLAPQGDGWLRSFDPATGRLLWEFDLNPKTSQWRHGNSDRNMALATPVFYRNRVYLAVGQDAEAAHSGPGLLWCIDPAKKIDGSDVSPTLGVDSDGNRLPRRRLQAVDLTLGEREVPNPDSAVVWHYSEQDRNGDGKIDFEERMHLTMASVAIEDGLLIAVDLPGLVHCLDAVTGQVHWTHDLLSGFYAPPLIIDGRVYLADEDGTVSILALSPEKRSIAEIYLGSNIYCAPVFANGVLYIASRDKLVAVASEEPVSTEAAAAGGHWPQWRGPETSARTIILPKPDLVGTPVRDRRTPRTGVNRAPDAVFVPTPHDVVAAMLQLASVKKQDVVYDLGSGDGRIVITAAKTYGVQAVGVEIDPKLVSLSQRQAKESKLEDLVKFSHDDMFQVDLSQTDVVAVFLYPRLLERLRPQFAKMKPGSRIVSHQFLMPDVEPDQEITMESAETGARHTLYLWTTPLKVSPPRPE